jgi:transposase
VSDLDRFHIMSHLGVALDEVRPSEYRSLTGKGRSFIKGPCYTLLSTPENLSMEGRRSLKKLLKVNPRSNVQLSGVGSWPRS